MTAVGPWKLSKTLEFGTQGATQSYPPRARFSAARRCTSSRSFSSNWKKRSRPCPIKRLTCQNRKDLKNMRCDSTVHIDDQLKVVPSMEMTGALDLRADGLPGTRCVLIGQRRPFRKTSPLIILKAMRRTAITNCVSCINGRERNEIGPQS